MVQESPEADLRRRAASIEINQVTKIFRDGRGTGGLKALDGASCSIAPGEFVCILGPSGRGKSTLLNILSGLDEHYEGSARFTGVRCASSFRQDFAWAMCFRNRG